MRDSGELDLIKKLQSQSTNDQNIIEKIEPVNKKNIERVRQTMSSIKLTDIDNGSPTTIKSIITIDKFFLHRMSYMKMSKML